MAFALIYERLIRHRDEDERLDIDVMLGMPGAEELRNERRVEAATGLEIEVGVKIATAFVEIRADMSKAQATAEKEAASMGKKFAQIFGAAAFGIGLKKAIDAADGLQEATKRTNLNFGSGSTQMEKYAASAAKTMGLSRRAFLDAANQAKLVLDNLGVMPAKTADLSNRVVQLGADFSAYFGVDITTATEAVEKGLQGATRGLKQFGITITPAQIQQKALTMGLWDGKGALDGNAKAQATLALIMDQSSRAQGFFAANSTDAAQAQKIAAAQAENSAASIGSAFLPVYERAVQVVGFLAQAFGMLPGPVQVGIVALLGIVAFAGPLSNLTSVVGGFTQSLAEMGVTASVAFGAFAAVAAIVAVATIATNADDAAKRQLTHDTNELVQALKDEAAGHKNAVASVIAAKIASSDYLHTAEGLGLTSKELVDIIMGKQVPAFDNLKTKYADLTNSHHLNEGGVRRMSDAYNVSAVSIRGLSVMLTDERQAMKNATAQTAIQNQVTKELGISTDQTTASTAAATTGADALKKSLDTSTNSFTAAANAADAFRQAVDAVFGRYMNMAQLNDQLQKGIDDVAKSFEANGHTLDSGTDKGRANRDVVRQQVQTILDFADAQIKAGATITSTRATVDWLTKGLEQQMRQAGLTQGQIDSYLHELGLTPKNITTTLKLAQIDARKKELQGLLDQLGNVDDTFSAKISAEIDMGDFDKAQAEIEQLAKSRGIKLNVSVSGGGQVSINAPGFRLTPLTITAHAGGGYIGAPTLSTLGEGGAPEAVLPLSNPKRMAELLGDPRIGGPVQDALGAPGGSGGPVTTINAPITVYGAEQAYVRQLEAALMNLQRGRR